MQRPVDHQERVQSAEDLGTTFLVEAAAGTGKTTLLIARIMAILQKGAAALPEIAAITFTEKAAGELKVRLRQAIESALRDGASPAQPEFRRALADIDSMTVSTIHSFCLEVISERPVEAGVEPGFAVADEPASSLLFEEAWEEWLAEEMTGENPALRKAIEQGVPVAPVGRSGSGLRGLAQRLSNYRDLMPSLTLAPKWTEADYTETANRIRSAIHTLAETMSAACANPDQDKGAAQIAALNVWCRRLNGETTEAVLQWVADCPSVRKHYGSRKNWSSAEALRHVKELFAEVKSLVQAPTKAAAHELLVDLVEWLRPFLDRYEKAKRRRRTLDFQDLLLRTRDMLARSRTARDYFKSEYRFILVDEFQDTDPLQTEIVFFLAERRGDFAEDWESVRLQPGKLFLVGDPKQSIYGFRRADLDLYGKVKEIIRQQGEVRNLYVNFRTVPSIIAVVNRVFGELMRGPTERRFEPEHVAIVPYREGDGKGPKVARLPPPAGLDATPLSAEAWRRKESGAIAACIQDLVEQRTSFRNSDGVLQSVQYRDVAVLYRYATGLEQLEDALRAHDVPYQVSGGKHYYTRLEFQDLLSVLAALENPYNVPAVIGALRSPFFGHSDEDLLLHFAAGGRFNYLADVPADCTRLSNAFEILRDLNARKQKEPIPSVLTRLFETTQALQVYAMKPHGEQRVANLLRVQDMARALAETDLATFGRFVRRLSEMESAAYPEGESPVAESDGNFVQIMTFHKAKGLEFPVVILAHLAAKDTERESVIVRRATRRLDLKLGERLATLGWDEALEDKQDRQEHERRRLFYVATTRARDMLVLPTGWWDDVHKGFLGYLDTCDADEDAVLSVALSRINKRRTDDFKIKPALGDSLPASARAFWEHRRQWQGTLRDRARRLKAGRRIATATDKLAEEHACAATQGGQVPDPSAVAFGTLVHKLLESADFASPGDLLPLAEAQARDTGLSVADIHAAADLAERTLRMPLIRERALKSPEMHKEVPFAANYNEELLEGTIDLVFIEDNEAVVLDFKTNNITAAQATAEAERYRPQAELYAHAMTAALSLPVKEVIFLFCRPQVAVPLMIPAGGSVS